MRALAWVGAILVLTCTALAWLGAKASTVNLELSAATKLVGELKGGIATNDPVSAAATVEHIRSHTASAKKAVDDPLWTLASAIPGVGPNFTAVAEAARSADDVAHLALTPLVKVFDSLNWETLAPNSSGIDLGPLEAASPTVASAAHAVRTSVMRLEEIDTRRLLPQVASPLLEARSQLREVTYALDASANASQLLPAMLGADETRTYLLMIQNNAEARASGGIPGAVAVLSVDKGNLTLGAQSSATDIGVISPPVPVDPQQQSIYSSRLGKFMQDVNLTPDFPTAASSAQQMWERKTGQRVDGVLSVDPITLAYILEATGPITITHSELVLLASESRLPTELNAGNVVKTLLSDVYREIEKPELQDTYFAGVAQEAFSALAGGKGEAKGLLEGISRGTEEGRVLVWSADAAEQSIITKYPLSGSVTGPSVPPAQFGAYFNDGTGAKMDYYVKRTVQLIRGCPKDGFEETTVRVTSTNTAPADAATSLPPYVTGNGMFGVPPGSVQTNIVAYGPVQAQVETAKVDGQKTDFAPYFHSNRPVGVLAIRLAPGESRSVDFTFGKIVQHTEPNVIVTPTVQDVKDVTLPTETVACS